MKYGYARLYGEDGFSVDLEASQAAFTRGCEVGNWPAACVGVACFKNATFPGVSQTVDAEGAVRYLERACAMRDADGHGVKIACKQLAGEAGVRCSCHSSGTHSHCARLFIPDLYHTGDTNLGISKCPERYEKYARRMCELRDHEMCQELSNQFKTGDFLPRNLELSRHFKQLSELYNWN